MIPFDNVYIASSTKESRESVESLKAGPDDGYVMMLATPK